MKLNNIVIILILILIYVIYYNCFIKASSVPRELLYSLLEEGKYNGVGKYNPTELHPYGIKSIMELNIMRTHSGVKYINYINLYDAKTNKLIDKGVRKARLDYKPNHENNIFQNSKSFIGNNLVSSSHGKVINYNKNSIVLESIGSWHISNHDFKNIRQNIKKENNKLILNLKIINLLFHLFINYI